MKILEGPDKNKNWVLLVGLCHVVHNKTPSIAPIPP